MSGKDQSSANPPEGTTAKIRITAAIAGSVVVAALANIGDEGAWSATVTVPSEGEYVLTASWVLNETLTKNILGPRKQSLPVRVRIRTSGPHVTRVEPQNFAYTPKSDSVTVYFDPDHPLDKAKPETTNHVYVRDRLRLNRRCYTYGRWSGRRRDSITVGYYSTSRIVQKSAARLSSSKYE